MSYEIDDKMVSHPDHYKSGKYEVIDILDEFCKDLKGTECICTANALKYILRWKKKNGTQDLNKAIWYLQHLVDYRDGIVTEDKSCKRCRFFKECAIAYKHVSNPDSPSCKDFEVIREKDRELEEHAKFDEELFEKRIQEEKKVEIEIVSNDGITRNYTIDIDSPTVYGGTVDLTTGEVKKLEPGCEVCDISECGFLKDPFMNPPYDILFNENSELKSLLKDKNSKIDELISSRDDFSRHCESQKETIADLMRESKEKQDSIDILTADNDDLKEKLEKAACDYHDLEEQIASECISIKFLEAQADSMHSAQTRAFANNTINIWKELGNKYFFKEN